MARRVNCINYTSCVPTPGTMPFLVIDGTGHIRGPVPHAWHMVRADGSTAYLIRFHRKRILPLHDPPCDGTLVWLKISHVLAMIENAFRSGVTNRANKSQFVNDVVRRVKDFSGEEVPCKNRSTTMPPNNCV